MIHKKLIERHYLSLSTNYKFIAVFKLRSSLLLQQKFFPQFHYDQNFQLTYLDYQSIYIYYTQKFQLGVKNLSHFSRIPRVCKFPSTISGREATLVPQCEQKSISNTRPLPAVYLKLDLSPLTETSSVGKTKPMYAPFHSKSQSTQWHIKCRSGFSGNSIVTFPQKQAFFIFYSMDIVSLFNLAYN